MRKNIPEDKKGKGKKSRKGIIKHKESLKINTNVTNYNIEILNVLLVHKIKRICQTPKQKKAAVIFNINKIGFKAKKITRDRLLYTQINSPEK